MSKKCHIMLKESISWIIRFAPKVNGVNSGLRPIRKIHPHHTLGFVASSRQIHEHDTVKRMCFFFFFFFLKPISSLY